MADVKYLQLNLQGLSIVGLWNTFEKRSATRDALYKIYGYFVYLYFTTFNVSEFVDMFAVITNLPMLMRNIGVTLLYCVTVCKATIVIFRKGRFERLFSVVRELENEVYTSSQEEIEIYEKSIKQNRALSKLFTFLCFSNLLGFYLARPLEYFFLGPQPENNYKVPFLFGSWFPFDKFASGWYEFAYVLQFIGSIFGGSYIAATDTIMTTFMLFSIGQFKLIQYSIENLHLKGKREEGNHELMDLYPEVVKIVKHHTTVIDFLNDLDDLINPIMLINFIICSLMICGAGLEALTSGLSVRLAMACYYLCGLLFQLFMFYYSANEVTLESYSVGTSVAQSQWYYFSPRVKQVLLMISMRAQTPSILSVGGFYAMSLETFVMVLKTTYSFLALFREVNTNSNG